MFGMSSVKSKKRVLVLGGFGREHALAWSISRSPYIEKVFVGPGNGGTSWDQGIYTGLHPGGACENVPLSPMNIEQVLNFVLEKDIYLTVVGDAEPLSLGIVDEFRKRDLKIFGPSAASARLESSKSYAKALMVAADVPTAPFQAFDDYLTAKEYLLSKRNSPVVVKADGLADGKGTFVCRDPQESITALDTLMVDRRFGQAGDRIIAEELLTGREISLFVFVNGEEFKTFAAAKDYKRIYANDQGPNTAGVGSIARLDIDTHLHQTVEKKILQPLVSELVRSGTPYHGILYLGLILTQEGPYVLEFNCRFGDPETQAILPLLKSDFFQVLAASAEGRINDIELDWKEDKCATVIACVSGYPQSYRVGLPILLKEPKLKDSIIFHAATAYSNGQLLSTAGRIFSVSSMAESFEKAAKVSCQIIENDIHFDGKYYRDDIGTID